MKNILQASIVLLFLFLLGIIYDSLTSQIRVLQQEILKPRPLMVIQGEKYSITEVYVNGKKEGKENEEPHNQ